MLDLHPKKIPYASPYNLKGPQNQDKNLNAS